MRHKPPGKIRIIGGEWRGRKLPVANSSELRPTPDRVRETLFNWLQPVIVGSECLDLFAGTGALGLEALSRGAVYACLVEQDGDTIRQLRENIETLDARSVHLEQADAMRWLANTNKQFDIIFLDPPFNKGLVEKCCELLLDNHCLKPGALIYVEAGTDIQLPSGLEVFRQNKAGQVNYMLLKSSN